MGFPKARSPWKEMFSSFYPRGDVGNLSNVAFTDNRAPRGDLE
jgi:hypothetical protein